MDSISIGILSTANIAQRSVIPALKNLPNHYNIKGIASRHKIKTQEVGNSLNIKTFDSYDALLQSGLDAVYIPLPNSLHFEWVEKALNYGIHVLAEKSLGCNLAEVEHLNQLAKEKKLVLLENFQFRFHRQLIEIKRLLEEGVLGELRSLRASFGFPPFKDLDNIRYKASLGGGALLDAGAYTTKISQILLGQGLEVKAASLHQPKEYEVDIWGGAFLQHPNSGLFSSLAFGFDHYYQCGIEIWGSQGKLTANRLFTAPANYQPTVILETSMDNKTLKISKDDHFQNMLLHFQKLITTGEGLEEEYSQNIDQARLLTEISTLSYAK